MHAKSRVNYAADRLRFLMCFAYYDMLKMSIESMPRLPVYTNNFPEFVPGTIWLQCGEEIKQVQLPQETITLRYIRHIFEESFKTELKNYSFGAERGILLFRDPFTRVFKELNDVR